MHFTCLDGERRLHTYHYDLAMQNKYRWQLGAIYQMSRYFWRFQQLNEFIYLDNLMAAESL